MKLSRKTAQGLKHAARWVIVVCLGLLGSVILGPSYAYAQSEIDPDHFDSRNTEPIPQPRITESKVTETRYDRTFSLPYIVLCNGKKLPRGKYSISLRSDGHIGQATLHQKGHDIEIAGVEYGGKHEQTLRPDRKTGEPLK